MAGDADRDLRMVVPFDEVKIGALILSPVRDEGADDAACRTDRVGITPAAHDGLGDAGAVREGAGSLIDGVQTVPAGAEADVHAVSWIRIAIMGQLPRRKVPRCG
jgi:hypothetical protein